MKKKYWVFKTIYTCPPCGREKVYRERRYTPKPEEHYQREENKEVYDYCD